MTDFDKADEFIEKYLRGSEVRWLVDCIICGDPHKDHQPDCPKPVVLKEMHGLRGFIDYRD